MMRVRELVNRVAAGAVLLLWAVLATAPASAEDGYDLWLRYAPLKGEALDDLREHAPIVPVVIGGAASPTIEAAETELRNGLAQLQGFDRPRLREGSVRVLFDCGDNTGDGMAGFSLRPEIVHSNDPVYVISAQDHLGCLYGSFALLRELSAGKRLSEIALSEAPAMPLRLLNHWDNPDGHVERGYAGRSIFDWWHLPEKLDPRMIDYARANASIGINGAVVNNVNARAFMLEPRYIAKLQRLADAWRPYGIRVYLSARFSAPRDIGGLDTADPLDPEVRAWWRAKADEIYASIPDFGGFLVKANSEGQPGPQDYGRTHADGANMLAQAIGELDPATVDGLAGVLLHCLADDDEVVRLAALKPFGKLEPRMLVAHASPLVERLLDDEEDYGVRQAAAEILSVLEPVTLVEFADGLEHANGSAVLRILELARAGKDLDESESESESESE